MKERLRKYMKQDREQEWINHVMAKLDEDYEANIVSVQEYWEPKAQEELRKRNDEDRRKRESEDLES